METAERGASRERVCCYRERWCRDGTARQQTREAVVMDDASDEKGRKRRERTDENKG